MVSFLQQCNGPWRIVWGSLLIFAAFFAPPSAFAADGDGDGMADEWEKSFGLDYDDPKDGAEDPDYDNLSNAEEFQLKSDPTDENSPDFTYYVAPSGSNVTTNGSRKFPWQTIGYALGRVNATAEQRVRIIVGNGVYEENLKLKSYVTVSGYFEPPTTSGKVTRPSYANIVGNHLVANNAVLENFILYPDVTTKGILIVDDVSMIVRKCIFRGPGYDGEAAPAGIGIQVETDRTAGTLIERCDFSGLAKGVEVSGEFPLIRQSYFEYISGNAIALLGGRTLGAISLGKADDPTTGFNSFDVNTITGSIVSSNWTGTLRMENNLWNTTNLALIAERLGGAPDSFDYDPPGDEVTYSLLPASITCTVVIEESDTRVLNANVSISPSGFSNVTQNANGVYVFPAVYPGGYTVEVEAPGLETTTSFVNVQQSELESVLVEMEQFHISDTNQDNAISLGELLRIIQFYNSPGLYCQGGTEDGFAPGAGSHSCLPHSSDYSPQDWAISLSELLRAIQFYNSSGYHACPDEDSEDGFCPGA